MTIMGMIGAGVVGWAIYKLGYIAGTVNTAKAFIDDKKEK